MPTPRRTVGEFGGSGVAANALGASIASVLLTELDVAAGVGGGIGASAMPAASAADGTTGELTDAAVVLGSAEAAPGGAGPAVIGFCALSVTTKAATASADNAQITASLRRWPAPRRS
jgi:hypothetical protein